MTSYRTIDSSEDILYISFMLRFLGVTLASILIAIVFSLQMGSTAKVRAANDHKINGSWYVNAVGAPFQPHVMVFHDDNTLMIDNPEAGDPHTSDSVGVGPWDKTGPDTIKGKFVEVNADRTTNLFASNLVVTFTLTLTGDTFTGPAEADYYDANWVHTDGPFPATLNGKRIKFDALP